MGTPLRNLLEETTRATAGEHGVESGAHAEREMMRSVEKDDASMPPPPLHLPVARREEEEVEDDESAARSSGNFSNKRPKMHIELPSSFNASENEEDEEAKVAMREILASPSQVSRKLLGNATSSSEKTAILKLQPFASRKFHELAEEGNAEGIRALPSSPSDAREVNALDDSHFTPLLIASSLEDEDRGYATCLALLDRGADPNGPTDKDGYTAMHWASGLNKSRVLRLLLERGGNPDIAATINGDTPLFRATRFGRAECIHLLIRDFHAKTKVLNSQFETVVQVCGVPSFQQKPIRSYRQSSRAALFLADPTLRSAIYTHEDCLAHETGEEHQEHSSRLVAILKELDAHADAGTFTTREFPIAPLEAVRRAHDAEYVDFLFSLDRQVREGEASKVAFTPRVQREVGRVAKSSLKPDAHCDTFFSRGTLQASLRACGAVMRAIDDVLSGTVCANAFCAVRPPSHHAGRCGLLDDAVSCGFCILNAVAVGALHALETYPDKVRRVAILDFDVHHGNGTEDVLARRDHPHDGRILFHSIHLYDKDEAGGEGKYCFYPGSGARDMWEKNIINSCIQPLWKSTGGGGDPVAVGTRHRVNSSSSSSSSSSSGGTGSTTTTTAAHSSGGAGGSNSNSSTGVNGGGNDDGSTPKSSSSATFSAGRIAFRKEVERRMLPALAAFHPDLILLSAGFDGAAYDLGNSKPDAQGRLMGGLDLRPEDYQWLTEKIMRAANLCCNGRLVSVLEGGYGRWTKVNNSSPAGAGHHHHHTHQQQSQQQSNSHTSTSSTVFPFPEPATAPRKFTLNREPLAKSVAAHVATLSSAINPVSND